MPRGIPKNKPAPEIQGDKGAPAAAKRLEDREAATWARIERLEKDLSDADTEFRRYDGDTEKQRDVSEKIALINKDLIDTQKSWLQLTKQVREFDKSIDLSRREGEMVPRSEVEEMMRQYRLCLTLGLESYIITISQSATQVNSPEEFYRAHSDQIRSCSASAIEAAVKDGKLPKWSIE